MSPDTVVRNPDPGGIFDSDEHRRVLANCGSLKTLKAVAEAVYKDRFTRIDPSEEDPTDHSEIKSIMDDLRSDGYLNDPDAEGKYIFTDKGLAALKAEHPNPPPPLDPEQARRMQEAFIEQEKKAHAEQVEASRAQVEEARDAALKELDEKKDSYDSVLDDLLVTGVPEGDE